MAPGSSVRNKSRKRTAELTSLRRQKRTRGKYKNKLMDEQTEWAHGGAAACLRAAWELVWTVHQYITEEKQRSLRFTPRGIQPDEHLTLDQKIYIHSLIGPLTSERDTSQGVRVSQVVGPLQKTTQHGWKCGKCWQMLKKRVSRISPQFNDNRAIKDERFPSLLSANESIWGPYIPKPSWEAIIPALSLPEALSLSTSDLSRLWREGQSKCVGNRRTPHVQRKSQHFLFSFPLLSPGCFPALPTSLPLCLAFPLSCNPVIVASSMFVHFCGFGKMWCFQRTV